MKSLPRHLRRSLSALTLILIVPVLSSCGSDRITDMDPPPDPGEYEPLPPGFALGLEQHASGFSSPVLLLSPPHDDRQFVVELSGRIRIIAGGITLPTPFLDISSRVKSGGEQGLLGMAFHPSFATNGWFYLNYTGQDNATRIERYTVSPASPNVADANSDHLVLSIPQPASNHNGGMLLFAPDGTLLVGMGDGGGGGDPQGNGQNTSTLLGAMLRIDVNAETYAIPSSNPFATSTTERREIWGYGLRNPWRFSIDTATRVLYIADVGQGELEEINAVPLSSAAVNYGWNIMEGSNCYNASSCNRSGLTEPVLDYGRADGCSVIGGFVYRGAAIPALRGRYFYSDLCGRWLRSFLLVNGIAAEERDWGIPGIGAVLSFGQDNAGELYLLTQGGIIYRIVRTA